MDYIKPFIPEKIKNLPVHMDFEGQKRAERLFQTIIILFAVVGFVWGYICQQFSQTVYILGAGFALSGLLTLPPWPMYRGKDLEWQKPRPRKEENESSQSTTPQTTSSSSSSKSKKKSKTSKAD